MRGVCKLGNLGSIFYFVLSEMGVMGGFDGEMLCFIVGFRGLYGGSVEVMVVIYVRNNSVM